MSLVELTLGLAAMVAIPVLLKVLILYRWHRAGLRWPGEDVETFVEHSPRFEGGTDSLTGLTREEYVDWASGKTADEEKERLGEGWI